jgi:hypothetical protein
VRIEFYAEMLFRTDEGSGVRDVCPFGAGHNVYELYDEAQREFVRNGYNLEEQFGIRLQPFTE